MKALQEVRNSVSDWLWLRALRKHRSRMGYRDAPRYTRYLEAAQGRYVPNGGGTPLPIAQAEKFRSEGWASFCTPETEAIASAIYASLKAEEAAGPDIWEANGRYKVGDIWTRFPALEDLFRGETGEFLRRIYGANFKIFYGVAYKSWRQRNEPIGSELWHSDGGPGTCINLMFCLSPVTPENGAMECLSWQDSLDIYRRERASIRRKMSAAGQLDRERMRTLRTEFYRETIAAEFQRRILQPTSGPGLVYAFANNILHKGGYPQAGEERYVCVFHIYPSHEPTPFERYRVDGVPKRAGLPQDPAF
jgi:hypothetical protein